jgi:hypothetical protein
MLRRGWKTPLGSGISKKNVGSEKHGNYDPGIPKKEHQLQGNRDPGTVVTLPHFAGSAHLDNGSEPLPVSWA